MKPFRAEVRWATELFAALFPAEAGLPSAKDLPMAAYYEDLLGRLPLLVSLAYRATVIELYWLPILFLRRLASFGGLAEEERERYLGLWAKSPVYFVRQAIVLLKMMAGVGYLGFPEVQRAVGAEYADAVPPIDAP